MSIEATQSEDLQTIDLLYGQIAIGPAGSGKTTYIGAMAELLGKLDREVIIVNLDPANDILPYKPTIDISDLVSIEEVMEGEHLGPNGALFFSFDFLENNYGWLEAKINLAYQEAMEKIEAEQKKNPTTSSRRRPYILFDSPGQIELFTNYPNFKKIIYRLLNLEKSKDDQAKNFELRLVTVNIVDAHYANDAGKFVTVVLNSLLSMLHIETPFISILSKVDIMEAYGQSDFNVDYYCELPDMSHLVERVSDDPFLRKYKRLTESLASIVESYGLVSYLPLNVKDEEKLKRVLAAVDQANGFYISNMSSNEEVLNYYRSIQADFEASKYSDLL